MKEIEGVHALEDAGFFWAYDSSQLLSMLAPLTPPVAVTVLPAS